MTNVPTKEIREEEQQYQQCGGRGKDYSALPREEQEQRQTEGSSEDTNDGAQGAEWIQRR